MDTHIKVSVIVPVYNASEYLAQTAEYIKNQTLQEIEIIYVDDGSTDDTLQILENIKSEDSRVTILTQKNSYAGVARNNGLAKAKGKYVVFWDSDDIFVPEALEEMYNKCEQDGADMCICAADHYDEEYGKYYPASTYLKKEYVPEQTPFTHEDIDSYLFNFSTNVPWNKMFNRQFVIENNIKYQPIKRANDNYFIMLAYFYAKKFTVVDKVLIHYRINYSASLTGGASEDPLCVYEAYKETYKKLGNEPGFEKVKQSFMNKALRAFFYFLSKQTTVQGYETLYNHYKSEIIEKWEFPKDEEYYYVPKDYTRLTYVWDVSAMEFLMREYNDAFDNLRTVRASRTNLKNKVADLKEKNEIYKEKIATLREVKDKLKEEKNSLKATRDELKANIKCLEQERAALKKDKKKLEKDKAGLEKKLVNIQESTSYKLGSAITYVPGKIKNLVKNGEKKV